MEIRRKLLMQENQVDSYIMNGLVLWMDGIQKGNIEGSWVDQKSGYVFEGVGNPTFGTDYVQTENSRFFRNATFDTPTSNNGTIEITISDFSESNGIVYMPMSSYRMAFGNYSSGDKIIWTTVTAESKPIVKTPYRSYNVASITNGLYVIDGQIAATSGADYWGNNDNTYNYIGKRSNGLPFTGKIHCIRIYNRNLSLAEMLHNQRIDNTRFSLGLTI